MGEQGLMVLPGCSVFVVFPHLRTGPLGLM